MLLAGNLLSVARLPIYIGVSAPTPQRVSANAEVAGDTGLICTRLAYQLDCFALKLFRNNHLSRPV